MPLETAGTRYAATADQIWRASTEDGLEPGDRLESERVLATRYSVSRETVRAALGLLADRGLVRSTRARGWYVAQTPPRHGQPRHTVLGFADYARERGLPTTTTLLSSGVRAADVDEAESLGIAAGAQLFEMRRLRRLDGLAVVVEHNRVPLWMCPALARTDFAHASLYATLRAADPPQYPRVARYSVEARPPTSDEVRLLEGDVPMLVATQLAFNQDDRPLEWTIAVYRGDRYRFRASITD
jgi:GntR family transcriptional regulator